MNTPLHPRLTNPHAWIIATGIACLTWQSSASAQVLLQDNFDSYANQAAFQTAWPATIGAGGTLSSTLSQSSPNSVEFGTVALRNDRSFAESGTATAFNPIRFSIDFYDTNSAASPYRQIASLIDGAGTSSGQLISIGLHNNQTSANSGGNYYMARILGYTPSAADPNFGPNEEGTLGSGTFFKLNDYGVGLRSTGWHNLAVEITDTEFRFYVDGQLAETVANTLTLRSYDSVRIGSGLSSTTAANFDNVTAEVVPEPTSAALLTLGIAGLCGMRRRRN